MNTKFKLVIGTIFYAGLLHGQVTLGTLKGKIVDNENKVIPQAKVWVEGQGSTNRMLCDMDGKFAFQAMKPGVSSSSSSFFRLLFLLLLLLYILSSISPISFSDMAKGAVIL